ncbi:MAG: hypothetical protein WCP95_13775 [Actinomycetes bacterium]
MGDARAKGAGSRGGLSQQELYFRLSAAAAEEARLQAQLESLRAKERRTLSRLETVAAHMARLQKEIDALAKVPEDGRGKQPGERGYGPLAWDVTELRY